MGVMVAGKRHKWFSLCKATEYKRHEAGGGRDRRETREVGRSWFLEGLLCPRKRLHTTL